MSEQFPEPKSSGRTGKVELDLSNYAIKADLKNATGVDTSRFAQKVDLTNLKSDVHKSDIDQLKNIPTSLNSLETKVDKLHVDKLVPIPVDLSKLSDIVENDVVKKDKYNPKTKNIENKILDITNLATNSDLNAKINEVKDKIPNITTLATATALTAVEIKYVMLVIQSTKLTILMKLKTKLLIMVMINILLLQNSIFLLQDQHKKILQAKMIFSKTDKF